MLDTWLHPITVDTTPPTVGNFVYEDRGLGPTTGLPYIGSKNYTGIQLKGITDSSGLEHGSVWSIDEYGSKSNEVGLEIGAGGSTSVDREIFPGYLRQYTAFFKVVDKAGNHTVATLDLLYPYRPEYQDDFEIVGIYDPDNPAAGTLPYNRSDLKDYAPYKSGMTIEANPIKVLAKIPKEQHLNYDDLGIGIGAYCAPGDCLSSSVLFEEGEFVYVLNNGWRPIPASGSYFFDLANKGYYREQGWINIQLAESANKPPRTLSTRAWNYDTDSWDTSAWYRLDQKYQNRAYDRFKVTFEPRPYRQRIRFYRYEIDPNDSYDGIRGASYEVFAEPNTSEYIYTFPTSQTTKNMWDATKDKESQRYAYRLNHRAYLYSSGLPIEMESPYRQDVNIDYDLTAPLIVGIVRDEYTVSVESLETTDYAQGHTSSWENWLVRKDLSSVTITTSNGKKISLPLSDEVENTHYNRVFVYSLDALPEGHYTKMTVKIQDSFGNSTVEERDEPFWVDKTPPEIVILNAGQPIDDGDMIVGLEAIVIELADPNSPEIKSVLLQGGPANDTVYLATRQVGDNQYALEYPRIFPAMNPGDEYNLTVTAVDASNNESTVATSFLYQPIDLVDIGDMDVLAINQALELPNNDPINLIVTPVLRTEEGQLAQGEQELLVTLRSDAELPLIIGGSQINPGETQTIKLLAEQDGRLRIPVTPTVRGQSGSADYMIEVPEISSSVD